MAGHAQTNCFLLFTYNQSLSQLGTMASSRVEWEHDYMGWASEVRCPLILLAQVFPVLKTNKQTIPSSLTLLAYCPLPFSSPSQQAS